MPSMAAASRAIIGATVCGAPWPITRLSTSIMKSGVARPSRLMSSDARASLAMTGRTREQVLGRRPDHFLTGELDAGGIELGG